MHTINERLMRLEPQETKCAYCEVEHSQDMEENYFIPLFKEQDRTNVIVYRSVKYKKIPVGVPRCQRCKNIHESASNKAKLYAWGIALGVVLFCFAVWGIMGIFAIFAGIFIGFGGTHFMENKLVRDQGILTKLEGAKENDTIQDLVIHGWSFNQPAA